MDHFTNLADAVEWVAEERGFDAAEEYVDSIPEAVAAGEVKSALWMLAWAYADPELRRQVVAELVPVAAG